MMLTAWLKRNSARRAAAAGLYQAAAAQSRHPVFYTDLGVPDTLDGRFDMLCLHVFLIVQRAALCGGRGRRLSQAVFDEMFKDVSDSLREIGIGDMGVPRHMKAMMTAFNGRAHAYDAAMGADDAESLSRALSRNVFRTEEGADLHPAAPGLANYMFNIRDYLAVVGQDAFLAGEARFPTMEAAPREHEAAEEESHHAQAV